MTMARNSTEAISFLILPPSIFGVCLESRPKGPWPARSEQRPQRPVPIKNLQDQIFQPPAAAGIKNLKSTREKTAETALMFFLTLN
ncbi:hypothetical protein C4J81_04860 [Deltaproteobacteria bacterium Smac51]|nr:hypothetical protein C4J81_04860 [Deltaproteobacteria bacterium Smac51]